MPFLALAELIICCVVPLSRPNWFVEPTISVMLNSSCELEVSGSCLPSRSLGDTYISIAVTKDVPNGNLDRRDVRVLLGNLEGQPIVFSGPYKKAYLVVSYRVNGVYHSWHGVAYRKNKVVELRLTRQVLTPGPYCFALDFETDDSGMPLLDKQRIDNEFDGGPNYPVTITSSSNLAACGTVGNTAATYDSDAPPHGQDPDLAVNSGNILILQTDANLSECSPGIFCSGNDDEDGGTVLFAFNEPVQPISIDLIDVDDSGPANNVTVTMTDTLGRLRTYLVPLDWTGDITEGQPGQLTLLLNTTAPQAGFNDSATAVQDIGFSQTTVVSIMIERGADCPGFGGGSGAIDNLVWCQ